MSSLENIFFFSEEKKYKEMTEIHVESWEILSR